MEKKKIITAGKKGLVLEVKTMQHLCYFVWVATCHNFLATSTLKFDVKAWAVETLRLWKSASASVCHLVHLQLNSSSHRSIPQNMRCIWAAWGQSRALDEGGKWKKSTEMSGNLHYYKLHLDVHQKLYPCQKRTNYKTIPDRFLCFEVSEMTSELIALCAPLSNGIFETQLIPRVACALQSLALSNRSCVSWKMLHDWF